MSFIAELWGRTPLPPEDPMPKSPEGGTTDLVIRQARIIHELRTELEALKKFTACTRSHPHEAMAQDCELRTEIARLTNELARLRAAPVQEAAYQAFEAMQFFAVQYPHMQKGYMVDALEALNQALATTPSPAPVQEVGLTEREVGDCIDKTNRESQYGQHQFGWSKELAGNLIAALRTKGHS